ncbi:MAG: hypothetical protein ACTHMT_12385 [Verrucomicrobiota bacterium]
MAKYLLTQGYKDAAAVIIGSTLEAHLRKLATSRHLGVLDAQGKPKKATVLNAELKKSGAYEGGEEKQITAWLHIRNEAAHGHYQSYTADQVQLMASGVQDFMKRVTS